MDTGVIIALILGFASIVSSICFGLIPNIRKEKLRKLENKNQEKLIRITGHTSTDNSSHSTPRGGIHIISPPLPKLG